MGAASMASSVVIEDSGAVCDVQQGLVSVQAALALLLQGSAPVTRTEMVRLHAASGRVVAEDVRARIAMPPFDRAAVDGFAVGAAGCGPFRVITRQPAGLAEGAALRPDEAAAIFTGAAVPGGTHGIAMREVSHAEAEILHLRFAAAAGDNIRRRGEDAAEGAVILSAGTRIHARHVALLAAAGVGAVSVYRPLRVAILSAGDELAEAGDPVGPSKVPDSNRPMLRALLGDNPIEIVDCGIVPDDRALIAAALRQVTGCDIILATGGVAGSETDHLLGALRDAGGRGDWMPIALKPGKPLVFGHLGDARCLFLPGNPVAAMVGVMLFAQPLVARLSGCAGQAPRSYKAILQNGWTRKAGRAEFAPAAIVDGASPDQLVVERIARAGAARLTPLAAADGLLVIDALSGDVAAGDRVEFIPFHR